MPDSESRLPFPGSEFIVGSARLVNARAEPLWIDARRFVLRVEGANGDAAFRTFDAQTGDSTAAFDPLLVAARLGALLGRPVEAAALPIERLEFLHDLSVVRFSVGFRRFECGLGANGHCRELLTPRSGDGPGVASPDGRWLAFRRGADLWLRAADGGTERRLTSDGAPDHAWAGSTGNSTVALRLRLAGLELPPAVCWSPDSRRLLTHRIDERRVAALHLLQHVPGGDERPRVHELRYAMAGEDKARLQHTVFDIDGGATALQHAPIALPFVSLIEQGLAGWTPDAQAVWFVEPGRWQRSLALRLADPASGAVRTVLEERADRFVELAEVGRRPNLAITRGGDVLWLSRRDGYAQLYRFDLATGVLRNRITEGPWMVRELIAIDEEAGCLWFTASGREPGTSPLFRRLYRVGLDGCGLTLLTPEDADHEVAGIGTAPAPMAQARSAPTGVGPGGHHLVWTRSRPDLPPRSVVARGDGSDARTIFDGAVVGGEVSAAMTPEPFQALAADGVTPVFGTLYRPRGFDPARRYALVDAIYPGPQSRRVATTYAGSVFDVHGALALALVPLGAALALHATSAVAATGLAYRSVGMRYAATACTALVLALGIYLPVAWGTLRVLGGSWWLVPARVPETAPPLVAGDLVWIDPSGRPRPGDLVVTFRPATLRRVRACEGQEVAMRDGVLLVDGVPSPWQSATRPLAEGTRFTVPPGNCFVLLPEAHPPGTPPPDLPRPSNIPQADPELRVQTITARELGQWIVPAGLTEGRVVGRSYPVWRSGRID